MISLGSAQPLAASLAVIRAYGLWGRVREVLHEPSSDWSFGRLGIIALQPLAFDNIDIEIFLLCYGFGKGGPGTYVF